MKKNYLIFLLGFFSLMTSYAQTTIKGSVVDEVTSDPIPKVQVTIEATQQTTLTNEFGEFLFNVDVPLGEHVLKISKEGFITKRYPIVVNEGQTVNITDMSLAIDPSINADLFTIALSDDELNDDTSGSDNISGLLSSSRDVYQRTAAFEFSSSFYRIRGLDSENGTVLINGVEMNKMYNGRPQWSNWGGLNDVLRNQEFTYGLAPSSYTFGGALGTTNINVRASQYREGGRLTYSSSDRSYANRLMASYSSGLLDNGWAYSISLGRRWGNEGFQDATLYDSNSIFASVEKRINDKHSLNFTAIYAPNRRGKSSPNTQEVYDLKGIKYNEYWGYFDGDKRNSRIKEVEEPIFMLNHYWTINSKSRLNTNVAYQFGSIGNSRLDYGGTDLVDGFPEGGGNNPSPTYYQNLPSYFLRNEPDNPGLAYGAEQAFRNDGQIDWTSLYRANIENTNRGGNAVYALYEDRTDDKQFSINSIYNLELTDNIILDAALNYRTLKSENFAEIIDLFGANGYLDVDSFADDLANNPDSFQNDIQNPNRIATEGDKFKYNYNLYADIFNGFVQGQFKYNKFDFYLGASVTSTTYFRKGLYENGAFPGEASYGEGRKISFTGFGAKGGFTYKVSGKHVIDANLGYITKAPSLRNTFSNSRENHNIVGDQPNTPDITEEKLLNADLSYVFRSPIFNAKITGYYTQIQDATEISFYFADGVGGDNQAFVQEVLQGIDKQHLGAEIGVEAQVTPTIKLKGVAALGQYTYTNNPNLYLTTEPNQDAFDAGFDSNGFRNYGESKLEDYKVAAGPQMAYSVGFEYRDPDYWWIGATANFLSNAYLDINPLTRTSNFNTDFDGNVFNDYDEALATELLKQEKFDSYMVVNLIGGKSWKIGEYYIGFFASINNLLDEVYKTGGFEQGRNANYRQLRDDQALDTPVFGAKYWYGRGTTYFANVYFRF
ncbi:MAG: TonB-dependent receptor [Bacteroidetes bacterium MedPE-SWsnd-G2]|nr:MAG: TonB-dependent receptor [Bacteroidetes bacterium MedPE-SWsnd-G2]